MNTDSHEAIWEGIQWCEEHPTEAEVTCTGCDAEMTARGAVLEQMQMDVQTRISGLDQLGHPFPPQAIDHIRLETLIAMVLSDRSEFLFEGEVGRRTILTLKAIQADISRTTLIGPEKRLTVVQNGQRRIKDNPQA